MDPAFDPCSSKGFLEGNVPVEAFMARELKKGALENMSGVVRFRQEFGIVE
jgi:predicted N-acetyltransferase YhbS